jgi:hypothetical protein
VKDIEQEIAEGVKRQAVEDEAAKRALSTPFPGALRDAFAIQPDIKVGKYNVRPFYDIDFEFLSALEHPLHKLMVNGINGVKVEDNFFPRGPMAWELAFIFTRSIDDVEAAFKKGIPSVKEEAKKEFSRYQIAALTQLSEAVIRQMSLCWEPVIAYGAPAKEGEEAKQPNPTSTEPLQTASGG